MHQRGGEGVSLQQQGIMMYPYSPVAVDFPSIPPGPVLPVSPPLSVALMHCQQLQAKKISKF